jgi:intraflagellar transport protein 172
LKLWTLFQYGAKKIIGSIRTEYHSFHLISLRLTEDDSTSSKKQRQYIAYLLDEQTVCVRNLEAKTSINIHHSCPIDFLELSDKCHHIIFRDTKRNLYIFDNLRKVKTHLLSVCGYAQWVPSSDVVVAQNGQMMQIWYNINDLEKVSVSFIRKRTFLNPTY